MRTNTLLLHQADSGILAPHPPHPSPTRLCPRVRRRTKPWREFLPNDARVNGEVDYRPTTASSFIWLSSLLFKEVNRNADTGRAVLFDLPYMSFFDAQTGPAVCQWAIGKNGGRFLDSSAHTHSSPSELPTYLDSVPDKDAYNRIALFSQANSTTPQFLTTGLCEVTSCVRAADLEKGFVYVLVRSFIVLLHS